MVVQTQAMKDHIEKIMLHIFCEITYYLNFNDDFFSPHQS